MSENYEEESVNSDALFDLEEEANSSISEEESWRPEVDLREDFEHLKDEIPLTNEQNLELRNFNLQIILADKNVENLELKKNLLYREKEEIVGYINAFKKYLSEEHDIDINEYHIDLMNKRLVKKTAK